MSRRPLLRRADAGGDLELFLVAAVSAVLAIRFFLHLARYPTVGGDALHIAHMLWGGLLMVAALVALLSFLGPGPRRLAALAGGAGFGTFIDEVGKFVTHDNDYFFEPAVGIIYAVFILTYLAVRTVHHGRSLSPTEHLQNALNGLGEAVVHDLDPRERRQILEHLDRSDPDHPLVAGLRAAVARVETVPPSAAGPAARLRAAAARRYRRLTAHRLFAPLLIAFFALQAAVRVGHGTALLLGWRFDPVRIAGDGVAGGVVRRLAGLAAEPGPLDWARLATTLLSAGFVVAGIALLPRSRLRAYGMFRRSVLVTIFLTQVLVFSAEQFSALAGLAFNLLVLAALRYMERREREQAEAA